MGINVLSLFDGMSCGQIALSRSGFDVDGYYASEVDKYAISVTQKNYPDTVQIGSVVDVKVSDLPKIDLLLGGSSCQDFSVANTTRKSAGMVGMRGEGFEKLTSLDRYLELKESGFEFSGESYLFWEYVRVLRELQESNPKVRFLLENVKMKQEWQDVISGALGVQPILIDSAHFSAQSRKRLYWANFKIEPTISVESFDLCVGGILITTGAEKPVADTPLNLRHERQLADKARCCTASMWKGAGNNGMTLIRRPSQGFLSKLSVEEVEALQTVPRGYTEGVSDTQRYKMLGNGWNVKTIEYVFSSLI